jgi:hypothetical protein
MAEGVHELAVYLHLARASESRRQMLVRDRLLVISAATALAVGLPQIADCCRERILAHNPGHLVRRFPTMRDAMEDESFRTFLKQMRRRYPREKAEQMLESLGLDMARERDTYFSDNEYAAALLGTTPQELTERFGDPESLG